MTTPGEERREEGFRTVVYGSAKLAGNPEI